MIIASIEELQKYLDHDIAWRKKELTHIKFLVSSSNEGDLPIILRFSIAMMYAHWEGYVKYAGDCYINFLKQLGLNYGDLTANFIALALRSELKNCGNTDKISVHHKVVSILVNGLESEANLPHKEVIKTNSNLSYEVFCEILFTLGLDNTAYELKRNLINKQLVEKRNNIVHGNRFYIEMGDFEDLYVEIILILECFKTQIITAATDETYKNRK